MKKFSSIISAFLLMVSSSGANAGQCWDAKPDFDDCKVKGEQGDAKAQSILGLMYAKGEGVLRDDNKAFEWYFKAAGQGHTRAEEILRWTHGTGKAVPQDDKKTVEWYSKAAEYGVVDAQYNLATIYQEGKNVPKDYKKAYKWDIKAAEQGNGQAQFNLGWMYAMGKGVLRDYVLAHMFCNISVANGGEEGVKVRDIIAKGMTSSQIAKAQRLAREWMQKHP